MIMPTAKEIRIWTEAIDEIVARDGVTRKEANENLIALLESHAADPVGTALYVWTTLVNTIVKRDGVSFEEASYSLAQYFETGKWFRTIKELRRTFPDLSDEEANTNLLNLLEAAANDPEGTAAFVWSNVIEIIMKRDNISQHQANENFWNLINNLEREKAEQEASS